jgi:phosphotransferase family enzyme
MWTDDGEPEVPLPGGDVTEGVVRVGDTVRRPVQENSPLVHALLKHLESVGFDGAPRFLGIDARGREVLTFIEGEVAGRPRPAWIADEGRLVSVARLVRAYDDAAVTFTPPPGTEPDPGGQAPPGPQASDSQASGAQPGGAQPGGATDSDAPPGIPPAPPYPPELIGHVDITPENVVFRGGEAVALIDFDLVKPATRADEVFNMMMWWAPLADPADVDPLLQQVDVPRRCRLLADAYGMSQSDRERLVNVAIMRTRRSWHLMKRQAETHGGGWQRMWDEGVGDVINRRLAWLERNAATLREALEA